MRCITRLLLGVQARSHALAVDLTCDRTPGFLGRRVTLDAQVVVHTLTA